MAACQGIGHTGSSPMRRSRMASASMAGSTLGTIVRITSRTPHAAAT